MILKFMIAYCYKSWKPYLKLNTAITTVTVHIKMEIKVKMQMMILMIMMIMLLIIIEEKQFTKVFLTMLTVLMAALDA